MLAVVDYGNSVGNWTWHVGLACLAMHFTSVTHVACLLARGLCNTYLTESIPNQKVFVAHMLLGMCSCVIRTCWYASGQPYHRWPGPASGKCDRMPPHITR